MKDYVKKRVMKVSIQYLTEDISVRQLANQYHVGKSTIHDDLRMRLPLIDEELYRQVDAKLFAR